MKKIVTSALLWLSLSTVPLSAQEHRWTAYMSYYTPTEIVKASPQLLYVLASNGLYAYNMEDHTIQTYDKATVLNDCDITHIAWSSAAQKLLITYQNLNMDVLSPDGTVININDYMRKNMTEDKTINNIFVDGKYAYLATGFGVIKIDVSSAEIVNTYNLGIPIYHCFVKDGYLYASSNKANTTLKGKLTDNLLNKQNWVKSGDYINYQLTMNPEWLSIVKTLKPIGPKYNRFGFMKMYKGALYTCGSTGINYKPGCIQVLKDGQWEIYQDEGISAVTHLNYEDVTTLDIDPKDNRKVMAGARNGLYEFVNGKFSKFYNNANSPIEAFIPGKTEYELVTGVKYDISGNLWLLNSQAPTQSLIEYGADGKWTSHPQPMLMKLTTGQLRNNSLGDMSNFITDSQGRLWFVNKNWILPSFYMYDISQNKLHGFTSFVNEDNKKIEVKAVNCIAEDGYQNMWIGTDVGPIVLNAKEATQDNPIFTQIKVPRNDDSNLADYLLDNVDISCIAVDKANRKWIGTNRFGVFLISSDGMKQIYHFTAANSPLLSDNIQSLAINENTGEAYFGTEKGLCSYTYSTQNDNDEMAQDNVYAYPNPVQPDYIGPITVTGLQDGADIKIVTVNGALINQGTATGNEYKWYGMDMNGHQVASGIYFVKAATKNGEKGVVCKIAIVR